MKEQSLALLSAPPVTSPPSGSRTPTKMSGSPAKAVHQKSSFRRLSDALVPGGSSSNPTMGGKKDIWLVTFNDVVLRCQRTGTTTLPLASAPASGIAGRTHSLPELQGKNKYATVGRRTITTKPRNLYKFLKVSVCQRVINQLLTHASVTLLMTRLRLGLSAMSFSQNRESSRWKSEFPTICL